MACLPYMPQLSLVHICRRHACDVPATRSPLLTAMLSGICERLTQTCRRHCRLSIRWPTGVRAKKKPTTQIKKTTTQIKKQQRKLKKTLNANKKSHNANNKPTTQVKNRATHENKKDITQTKIGGNANKRVTTQTKKSQRKQKSYNANKTVTTQTKKSQRKQKSHNATTEGLGKSLNADQF